jgi:hypothetical protein
MILTAASIQFGAMHSCDAAKKISANGEGGADKYAAAVTRVLKKAVLNRIPAPIPT